MPVFDGQGRSDVSQNSPPIVAPSPVSAAKVPQLSPNDRARFVGLFEKSAPTGMLEGEQARDIFLKARLPNETLGQIWNLADTQGRGQLNQTEFVIAMHLIQCTLSGALKQIPQTLPPGLHEAASARAGSRSGSRSSARPGPIPRQYSGSTRPDWVVSPQERARFDSIFSNLDKHKQGAIGAEEIVPFLTTSKLSEQVLAQVWDLADVHNTGQFTKREFAIAMYLVQQKLAGRELPTTLPQSLLAQPDAGSRQSSVSSNVGNSAAMPNPIFMPGSPVPQQQQQQQQQAPAPAQSQQAKAREENTKESSMNDLSSLNDLFSSPAPSSPKTQQPPRQFVPTSSFGQSLASQDTGGQNRSASLPQQGTGSGVSSPAPPTTTTTLDPAAQNAAVPTPPAAAPPASRDLLSEPDNETSKVSNTSTEFANLSNQIGSLTAQTKNLTDRREATEGELSKVQGLKSDIETRLASLRANYDAEVKKVKDVEGQLEASRQDTKKVQQEYSVLEGSFSALQSQYNEVANQLAFDQQENANLKEKIKATNDQIANLKADLERAQKDAKQQRNMVSVNSKQLSVAEEEKSMLESELRDLKQGGPVPEVSANEGGSDSSKEINTAADTASAEQHQQQRQQQQQQQQQQSQPPRQTPSPGNPFFSGYTAAGVAAGAAASSQQRGFEDSFSQMEIASPSTVEPARSSTHNTADTPDSSPPTSEFHVYNPEGGQPPTFTLPIARPESATSSVQNNPPQSVRGDLDVSRPDSPEYTSEPVSGIVPPDDLEMTGLQGTSAPGNAPTTITSSTDPLRQTSLATLTPPQGLEQAPPNDEEIFTPTAPEASKEARSESPEGSSESFEIVNAEDGKKKDEDEAINKDTVPETEGLHRTVPGAFPQESPQTGDDDTTNTTNTTGQWPTQKNFNQEFPPIQEFDQPDDSSSDEEEDTTASAIPSTAGENKEAAGEDNFLTPTSTGEAKNKGAEKQPELASGSTSTTEGNGFTSATSSPGNERALETNNNGLSISTTVANAPSVPAAAPTTSSTVDTPKVASTADDPFANAFSGLSQAKEEKEDEPNTSFGDEFNFNHGFDDFNTTFDNAFTGFKSNNDASAQQPPTSAPTNDEWEQLFTGFSNNAPQSSVTESDINDAFSVKNNQHTAPPKPPSQPMTPHSQAVEHLTNMGFDRTSALDALKKKNYDLTEASNYLLDN